MKARANFSTTAATAVRPATVTAFNVEILAIAPAPITAKPFAANTAIILITTLLSLFNFFAPLDCLPVLCRAISVTFCAPVVK
jgi:hypothetical protein